MNARVQSDHFPFLNVRLGIHGRSLNFEALIDTGFDGFVATPATLLAIDQPPDDYHSWSLADGSRVTAPVYLVTVAIGDFPPMRAILVALGDEPLVGRAITDQYRVVFDHGQRVIVEP